MVQHRTATAVVGGAFMLLNGSAAVGLFCYGFSVFTLSDRQVVASPLFHAAEIALALIVHTFHVLMGSVYVHVPRGVCGVFVIACVPVCEQQLTSRARFWKLRLMDQRADLLASIQRYNLACAPNQTRTHTSCTRSAMCAMKANASRLCCAGRLRP
jgi:hypothetical protein